MKGRAMKVHERILLLRWVLPSLIFLFVAFYQLILFRLSNTPLWKSWFTASWAR